MDDPKAASQPRTIVEDGTILKGSITSTCPILVQGTVEGTVVAPGVTVSASGSLSGNVTTDALRSIGTLSGEYDVQSAQLSGTVSSKTIVRAETIQLKLSSTNAQLEVTFSTPGAARRRA